MDAIEMDTDRRECNETGRFSDIEKSINFFSKATNPQKGKTTDTFQAQILHTVV